MKQFKNIIVLLIIAFFLIIVLFGCLYLKKGEAINLVKKTESIQTDQKSLWSTDNNCPCETENKNHCWIIPCPWQELDLPVWAYPDEN